MILKRSLKDIRPCWGDEDFPVERQRSLYFGVPPFGYVTRNGKLVENPTESITLLVIFELRSEGKTLMAIADILNDRGLRPRKVLKWDHSSIRKIIQRHKHKKLSD